MQLVQLKLTNVACFEDLVLDFTQEEGDAPCPWVILLGSNGSGKSTILRMLGLALLGRELVHQVTRTEDWRRHVRAGKPKGRVVATMLPSKTERKDRTDRRTRAIFDLGPEYSFGIHQDVKAARADMAVLDTTLHSERLDGGWFACGYGPYRRVLPPGPGVARQVPIPSEPKALRFATLFDDALALSRVTDWLVGLEFRRLKEARGGPAEQQQKLALEALERVLPGAGFKCINKDGEVIFRDRGADVPLDRLSDGYRSVGGLVGDLIRWLVGAFPRAKNPMASEGVVLIDEIDLHLHPAWQAAVVEQLRDLFPKLQFIVSSHSPFVAQDAGRKDTLIVLERDAGGVTVKTSPGFVSGWRADQILTSRLFGLSATRDVSLEAVRRQLQGARARTESGLTEEESRGIEEARHWLDAHVGPGERTDVRELFQIARRFSELMETVLQRGVEV